MRVMKVGGSMDVTQTNLGTVAPISRLGTIVIGLHLGTNVTGLHLGTTIADVVLESMLTTYKLIVPPVVPTICNISIS